MVEIQMPSVFSEDIIEEDLEQCGDMKSLVNSMNLSVRTATSSLTEGRAFGLAA